MTMRLTPLATINEKTHVQHHVLVKGNGNFRSWKGKLHLFTGIDTDADADLTESTTDDSSSCGSSVLNDGIFYSDKDKGIFSFYQEGDGSAQDPDNIPTRYLRMANNDRSLALQAVQKTLEWREDERMDDLLMEPHVNFDICKQVVPHYYIGRDVEGHVVYVQRPALLNMDQVKTNGLTFDDLLRHSIYVQEYIWQIVEADNANATITSIIDIGDVSFTDLRQQDKVEFLQRMAKTFDDHFPMRAHKTLIVNAPRWFHLLYSLVKPLLRESTTDMIEICTKGKKQDATLLQHLGKHTSKSLPDFCWSSPSTSADMGQHATVHTPMEKDLRDFVVERLEAKGLVMKPILS